MVDTIQHLSAELGGAHRTHTSLGGIGAVQLPTTVEALTIFADNDNKDPDKAARFLRIGIDRHRRQSRTVTVLRPPRGDDFNDWWLSRCGEAAL